MSARGPISAREPSCIHDAHQPASACNECQHSDELREWARGWDEWVAENPDSPEARWVADADRAGWQPVV